jgi:hypothetical protein
VARDLCCPICNADLPLAGDESPGDEVFCVYCGAPCRLKGTKSDTGEEETEVEADF